MADLEPHISDRGLAYLEPTITRQKAEVRCYTSSAADGPHLWVKIEQPANEFIPTASKCHAHFNLDQAREHRDKLDKMIELAEQSWGLEPGEKYDYEEDPFYD